MFTIGDTIGSIVRKFKCKGTVVTLGWTGQNEAINCCNQISEKVD